MVKGDLIHVLAKKENLKKREAKEIVNLIFKNFKDTLVDGGRIEIRGFGSLAVRDYDTYTGRNPKTGELITVGTKKLPHFRTGDDLRKRVNSRR